MTTTFATSPLTTNTSNPGERNNTLNPEIGLTLKSRNITFAHNVYFNRCMLLQVCTRHGSTAGIPCAKLQKHASTTIESMNKRYFARISCLGCYGLLAIPPNVYSKSWIHSYWIIWRIRPDQNCRQFADDIFASIFLKDYGSNFNFQKTIWQHWFQARALVPNIRPSHETIIIPCKDTKASTPCRCLVLNDIN